MSSILIVQYSANLDGSAYSGLMSANGFRERGWETHVVFRCDGPVIERYRAAGHKAHFIRHENWLRNGHLIRFLKNTVKEWQASSQISELIAHIRPDVVYVNTAASLAGILSARRNHLPRVWHLRELFADVGGEMNAPRLLHGVVQRSFAALADRTIVNSRAVAVNMLHEGAANCEIVPNGVEAGFFNDRRTKEECKIFFQLPNNIQTLGVPGSLRPMKGHEFFFEALKELGIINFDWLVAVTGTGDPSFVSHLQSFVRRLGLESRVRFLGTVEDMIAFYRACDVVCIPSKAEPFGRTVIEAFAAGTPVIATAVGGMKETIRDGESGLLVEYGNRTQLASAIQRMLTDSALRARVRETAATSARSQFHESIYKARIVDIVVTLIDGVDRSMY